MTIRETIILISIIFAGLIVCIGAFVAMLLEGEQRQTEIEASKYRKYNLALELKKSSDDLTRFARTYAATGDPTYEDYFKAIVAIRDGKIPHPSNFSGSYWDFVAGGVFTRDEAGETYSIEKRMLELGLSIEEKNKLTEAKQKSDALINLENTAFHAIKGLYKDENGEFTVKGEPDLETARRLLYGKEYHEAKAQIMKPINDFFTLLEWRTTNEHNAVRDRNRSIILGITVLTLITIAYAVFVFFLLKRKIINPLSVLEAGAKSIEGGDYSYHIDIATKDEIGS